MQTEFLSRIQRRHNIHHCMQLTEGYVGKVTALTEDQRRGNEINISDSLQCTTN